MMAILFHITWFGVSAHKSIVFYPILIIGVWFFFSRFRALSLIPIGLTALVILSCLIFTQLNYILPASLFIRRLFFVIANLSFDYYTFFDINEFVWWSNSITSFFIKYHYNMPPARLIGAFRDTQGWANDSFLATGFMHAGIVGVILYSIIVGLLLRISDSMVNRNSPTIIVILATVIPFTILFTSADLPTALLTHGLAMAFLMLYFLGSHSPLSIVFPQKRLYRVPPQKDLDIV